MSTMAGNWSTSWIDCPCSVFWYIFTDWLFDFQANVSFSKSVLSIFPRTRFKNILQGIIGNSLSCHITSFGFLLSELERGVVQHVTLPSLSMSHKFDSESNLMLVYALHFSLSTYKSRLQKYPSFWLSSRLLSWNTISPLLKLHMYLGSGAKSMQEYISGGSGLAYRPTLV